MKIYDFHLWLRPTVGEPGTFTTIVLEASVPIRIDTAGLLRIEDLEEQFAKHEVTLHRAPQTRGSLTLRRANPAVKMSTIGRVLFDALFPDDSQAFELLGRTCVKALNEAGGDALVRLKLDLGSSLNYLPWEDLRGPDTGGTYEKKIKEAKISVVRLIGKIDPKPPLGDQTWAIVVVLADYESVVRPGSGHRRQRTPVSKSFEQEVTEIEELITAFPNVIFELVSGEDTYERLTDKIARLEGSGIRVVGFHFIGHGGSDGSAGGFLIGLDEDGEEHYITRDELRVALEPARSLQWVFLNACSTAWELPGSPLSGLANYISQYSNVPTVLAYLRPVKGTTACKLSVRFYSEYLINELEPDSVIRRLRYRYRNRGGLVSVRRFTADYLLPEMMPIPAAALPGGSTCEKNSSEIPEHLASRLSRHNREQHLFISCDRDQQLDSYAISRFPVTNSEFDRFIEESGHRTTAEENRAPFTWRDAARGDRGQHPVVYVSVEDAEVYCQWVTQELRWKSSGVRLPTLEEWLRAFRGDIIGWFYPWGQRFNPEKCNGGDHLGRGGTMRVDDHRRGASPYGVVDMVGNVAEWTGSEREAKAVVVGGSCLQDCELLGLYGAGTLAMKKFYFGDVGFRCVRKLP